jgi:hypothetical protein
MNIMGVLRTMIFALAPMVVAHAQMLPAIVQDEIYESRKNCEPDHAKMDSDFIVERDINGDGRKDYILHYSKFQCGDNSTFYCGTAGCLTQVFASRQDGTYVKALDQNVRGIRFGRVKGRPAMRLELHGSACGKEGAAKCSSTLFWNRSLNAFNRPETRN